MSVFCRLFIFVLIAVLPLTKAFAAAGDPCTKLGFNAADPSLSFEQFLSEQGKLVLFRYIPTPYCTMAEERAAQFGRAWGLNFQVQAVSNFENENCDEVDGRIVDNLRNLCDPHAGFE